LPDDDARLRLYLAHRAALLDYATPIVGDRGRAEDVVQEAFLRFSPPDGPAMRQPTAYLYRIVRNLALDLRRSLSADRRRDQAHLALVECQPPAPTPEEQALDRDRLRRIASYLAELPPDTRRAFEMHRVGGYSLKEIADHLGVSVPTASRWAQDAVRHVVRRLEGDGR